jgi:hypothetical protein
VHSQSVSSFILNINTAIIKDPVEGEDPTLVLYDDHYSWDNNTRVCNNIESPSSIVEINSNMAPFVKSRLPNRMAAYPRWVDKTITIDPTLYPNPNDVTSFDNEVDFLMYHYCECSGYTWDTNHDYLCIHEDDVLLFINASKATIVPGFDVNLQNYQKILTIGHI